MPATPDDLRRLMRVWATGVTLVTARQADEIHGMTVSSFTSISIEPPRILVALQQSSRTHRLVTASGKFAVAILAEDQEHISNIFAGRIGDDENRFQEIDILEAPSGCPIPKGCLAYLDCQVVHSMGVATHSVFIGEVMETFSLRQAPPLLYFDQNYRTLTEDN